MNEELDGFDSPDWDIQRLLVWVSLGNRWAVNAAASGHPWPELAIQLTASENARITKRADIAIRNAFAANRIDCYAIRDGNLVKLDAGKWASLRIDYGRMVAFAPGGTDQWQHLRVSSKQARAAFWNAESGVASSGAQPELPPPSQNGDKRPAASPRRGRPKGQFKYPGDDDLVDKAIIMLVFKVVTTPHEAASILAPFANGQSESSTLTRLFKKIKPRWTSEQKSAN
jgi:hypothetical protein